MNLQEKISARLSRIVKDTGLVEKVMRRNDRYFVRWFKELDWNFSDNKIEFDSAAYVGQEQFLWVSKLFYSGLCAVFKPFDMDVAILLVDVNDLSEPEEAELT